MITNVLATLLVCVVTNVYSPTQYWVESFTYPPSGGYWSDSPPWYGNIIWGSSPKTRDNPDVQYVEVREVHKWHFNLEGVPDYVISDTLLSKTKRTRKVETKETWAETPEPVYTNVWASTPNVIDVYCVSNDAIRLKGGR